MNKSWCNKCKEDDDNTAHENIQTNENTSIEGKNYLFLDPSETTNKTWSDMENEIDHRIACEECTCHTPNLPDLQRNGIPGGVCHSTTVTVTLNDLKCRLENTAFDH